MTVLKLSSSEKFLKVIFPRNNSMGLEIKLDHRAYQQSNMCTYLFKLPTKLLHTTNK